MYDSYSMKHNCPRDTRTQLDEVASFVQAFNAAGLALTSDQITSIQLNIEMNQIDNLIKQNGARIWLDEKVGWRAYYFNEAGKKKFIKGKEEKVVRKKLADIIKSQLDNPTFKEVYDDWIARKIELEKLSIGTVNRYSRQYKQSLSEFGEKRIKEITPEYLEEFLLKVVQEKSLTRKAYSNTRTLIKGTFNHARRKGIVTFSINDFLEIVEIPNKLFKRINKENDELVFMDDEKKKLMEYFNNQELDLMDLGILLMFYTGLRPGEMVALEMSDVENDQLNVRRTEVRYKKAQNEKDVYEVQGKTKTLAGERLVRIPTEAQWIISEIKKLNPDGTYLFEKNCKRIKACSFDSRLRTICKKIGLKEKSMNKIRKTYASQLLDNGVSESVIIAQMGHTNITTTKNFYYKNQKGKQQVIAMLDDAFADMPLKKISQA